MIAMASPATGVAEPRQIDAAPVSYGEQWDDLHTQPAPPLDAKDARGRHEAGRPYVAYLHMWMADPTPWSRSRSAQC